MSKCKEKGGIDINNDGRIFPLERNNIQMIINHSKRLSNCLSYKNGDNIGV